VLYPDVADREALYKAACAALRSDRIATTADLRRLLGGLDRQRFPSPVSVRFRAGDVSTTTLEGLRILVDRADASVSLTAAGTRRYEPHLVPVLAQHCRPGMTAVDAGANIGIHTVALGRLVGPAGRVIAVEPSSENCRLLLASARENGLTNVEVHPVALDEREGWSYLTGHIGSNAGLVSTSDQMFVEGSGWIVPTRRLDELVRGDVHLMKLDVEGAEGRLIRGGTRIIERCRPVVISEFSCEMLRRVSRMEPLDYLSFFTERGYRISIIDRSDPGSLRPVSSPDALLATWGDELRIEDLLIEPQ
jgi:FkbM family methyltransferase